MRRSVKNLLGPWLIPPTFEDKEKTRAASLMYAITWVVLIGALLMAALTWNQDQIYAAAPLLYLAGVQGLFLWLIRQGNLMLPGLVQPLMILCVNVYILYAGNGLHDIAILGYVIPLLLAGLFARWWAPIIIAALEGGSVLFLFWAEQNEKINSPFVQFTEANDIGMIASLLVIIGVLLSALFDHLEKQANDLRTSQVKLLKANVLLETSYNVTLESWARALEIRDREAIGHTKRVTDLTMKLAQVFGFEGEALEHIRRGAILHDVGKMGIPDKVYYKSEELNSEETKIIRKHVDYAADLLGDIEFLKPALKIPLYHHERWDGVGYPGKLCGEEIPLEARIFAVVDVWDALVSKRPYREAWGHEKALAYVKAERGKHFDPEVVDRFLAMMQNGRWESGED